MTTLVHDLRYTLRQLRRAPAFTAGVAVVLALGIGTALAMLSVLRATLLRPLPYSHAGELLMLSTRDSKGQSAETGTKILDIEAWQQRSRTLQSIAYFNGGSAYLTTESGDQSISNTAVSANLFSTLGTEPQLGRAFTAAEQQPGQHAVVLSDAIWRTHFHADRKVLGRTVALDGEPYTVIGVMPRGFEFPARDREPQIWTPAELPAAFHTRDYNGLSFRVLGRRNSNASVAEVTTELNSLQQSLRPFYTGDAAAVLAPSSVAVQSYRGSLWTAQHAALLAVGAAVAALWLISCASAAGLLLARSSARRQEIAIRSALGATAARLAQHTVLEALLLAGASAAAGMVLARLLIQAAARVLLRELGIPPAPVTSPGILLAAVLLLLSSMLLLAGAPLLLQRRMLAQQANPGHAQRTGVDRSRRRLQKSLVVGELALCLTFLATCGMLLRSVAALGRVPLGFRTDHILIAASKLPAYRYKGDLMAQVYNPLLQRARRLPGVSSAALTTAVPLSGDFDTTLNLYMTKRSTEKPFAIEARMRASSPELQAIFGFPMREGRWFTQADAVAIRPVAVVNRAFADLFRAGGVNLDALHITIGKNRPIHVIGVLPEMHQAGIAQSSAPEIDFDSEQLLPTDGFYQPLLQSHVELVLRTSGDPVAVKAGLQRALRETDPALATAEIRTMEQVVSDSIGAQVLLTRILEGFAALAFLIALTGLYSLLSYVVTARTSEMGLRLALGAQRSHVLNLVLREAAVLLTAGIVCGAVASFASGRLIHSLLYGSTGHAWLPILLAITLLLLTGLLAALLPAHRAAYTDPMQALRTE